MQFETIELSREDKLAILTLNRPEKRNALSIQMRKEIDVCLGDLEKDSQLCAVIILGNGPIFCAGFDKSEFYNRDPEHLHAMKDSSIRYHRRLAEFPLPLIAGIHGPALGGGFDLAVLCDLRIAAPQATFSHPEIKFGAPALFNPLKEIIGGGLARDLVLTGRAIDAQEAFRIGLVSEIVEASAIKEACIKTANLIAQSPASTLRAIKKQIVGSFGGWDGHVATAESGGLFDFF